MQSVVAAIVMSLLSFSALGDDSNNMKSWGVDKQTTDTLNTRSDTYKKEVSDGNGVYVNSTKEYKNSGGERDTSANEKERSGSVGVGIYKGF